MKGVPNKRGCGRPREKRFKRLRERIAAAGLSSAEIGERLKLSSSCIRSRMRGETPWDVDEAYAVMDLLEIPPEELHIYFPKHGIEATETTVEYLEHYLTQTNQVLVDEAAFRLMCQTLELIQERVNRGVIA